MRRLALALLLLLAACQPLPHPFADDRPPDGSPMLRPPDSAGVLVQPPAGAPAPFGPQLARAMAAALRDADVPASTDSRNRRSFELSGTARRDAATGVVLDWTLRDAKGAVLGRHSDTLRDADAAWTGGDETLAKAAAQQAAPAIARLVEGDAPLPVATTDPIVAVAAVTGAPGDGNQSLARAIGDALRRLHFKVAAVGGAKANFVLTARIEMSPPKEGKQAVAIHWTLSRQDGKQVGEVNQANAVPAGSLDGAWADVAFAVANAAAPGIAALVKHAQTVAASP